MGITWVAEIISFFVSWKYGEFYTYKYVSIFDVINALQGTFIAILMIFDAKTVKNIKGKLGNLLTRLKFSLWFFVYDLFTNL